MACIGHEPAYPMCVHWALARGSGPLDPLTAGRAIRRIRRWAGLTADHYSAPT